MGRKHSAPQGDVNSRWEKTNTGRRFEIVIPANTTAQTELPDGRSESANTGRYIYGL